MQYWVEIELKLQYLFLVKPISAQYLIQYSKSLRGEGDSESFLTAFWEVLDKKLLRRIYSKFWLKSVQQTVTSRLGFAQTSRES